MHKQDGIIGNERVVHVKEFVPYTTLNGTPVRRRPASLGEPRNDRIVSVRLVDELLLVWNRYLARKLRSLYCCVIGGLELFIDLMVGRVASVMVQRFGARFQSRLQ